MSSDAGVTFFDDLEVNTKKHLERSNQNQRRLRPRESRRVAEEEREAEHGDDEDDYSGLEEDDEDEEDGTYEPDNVEFAIMKAQNDQDAPLPPNGKRVTMRVKGGRIALPKPISSELDSDDELLVFMKTSGYSDLQIVNRFKKDGRIHYDSKTIMSRFRRILNVQEIAMDKALANGTAEWEGKHDEALVRAWLEADQYIEKYIQKTLERRWNLVHDKMRNLMPEARFSAEACRHRYSELVNGVAKIPIDMDDNPDQRRAERDARLAQIADDEEAKEKEEKIAKERAALETWMSKVEKDKQTRAKEQRRTEKIREEARRAENRAAEKLARLHAMEKKYLPSGSGTAETVDGSPGQKRDTQAVQDPRSKLTQKQLMELCAKRSVECKGMNKQQLVTRLRNYDAKFSNKQLQARLKDLGRATAGTKDMLLYRLADVDNRYYNDHYNEFVHESDEDSDKEVDEDEKAIAEIEKMFEGKRLT